MTRRRSHRSTLRTLTVLALVVALLLPSAVPVGDARAPAAGPASNPTPGGPAGAPLDSGAAVEGPSSLAAGERPAAAVARDPAPAAGGPAAGPRDVEGRRLQLVTGETVALHDDGGEPSYEVVSGGPVRAVTTNDRTYLLPEGVDLGTYDRSLFEVEALRSARHGDGLPVLLETDAPASAIDAPGIRNVRRLRSAGVVAAELDPARAGETVERLVGDGLVRSVELDRPVEGPPTRRLEAGRTVTPPRNLTGEGVTVAVLDTGIDATHPDLEGRVVDRVDLVERDEADGENATAAGNGSDPALDENGHGTLVAGVVAGDGNDDGEHAGVAPGADLIDVRVMDDRGAGHASTIIEGIETAVERDVDVILLSLGTSIDGSDEIAESVEWATERGVVVVAAAGNRGRPRTIGAPGRPGGAITVGATDGHGSVADYSSRGPTLDGGLKPDLVAPGREVVGPRSSDSGRAAIDDDGRYTWVSGTSVAAPQVAGVVALLLQAELGLTPREVEARLGSAARPVDGGSAYAQGSGEVDVRGALNPDVVVSDPVVDFGLIEADRTANRTITFANHDDRVHALSFDASVRNEDLGAWANGTASLSRRNLSLAPGERANLTLSVDGDAASGAHAGEVRYSVDGEPRTVAFGFVRGGTVTVEKRPLTAGANVDGEALWVLNEEGTHDELLAFENGTASFVAGGGTYLLWSWGTDEPTGTPVFLSERRGFSGPEGVVLDERETVPVGVDAGRIVERYGPLVNLSVTASVSTDYGDEVARLSVSDRGSETRTIRASPDPEMAVATTYMLTTEPDRSAALDARDVFHLGHGVRGLAGPSVAEVDPDRLETTEYRFHRTTVDETYRVQDRMRVAGVWNQIQRRWFDLGGRRVQRVHRVPGATYHRDFRGDGWDAYREPPGQLDPPADERAAAQVLAHPMVGLFESLRVRDGAVSVSGTPFADGSGTRFDPAGDHRLAVAVNGTVVRDERVRGGSGSLDGVAVESGQRVTVRLVGDNSGGRLSTRTLTEVTIPAYDEADDRYGIQRNRPPTVSDVSVPGANAANAVPPGEVTAVYDVDAVGPVVDPTVWYAAGAPEAPPWRDRSSWRRAETRWFDGDLHATFRVGAAAETVSLAAEFRDIRRHRTRTMTLDAVHVGAAPNTSTAMLIGRFLAPNGSAATNDTVVVDPVGDGRARFVSTGVDGRFEVELPRGRSYDLTYLWGEPWGPREPTADGRPAWLPLERVRIDEDVDLGERRLPEAGRLGVRVTDERGEAVPGATVRVTQRSGNVSVTDRLRTAADGLARHGQRGDPGIALAGSVAVEVEAPEDDLYPAQTHRLNLTVEGPRVANVTLRTAPPEAVLTAFGTFEPGAVVFLHAYESDAPAGIAEYRWDLDGDGAPDRVTAEPIVRYVPGPDERRPTLTVVDRAGKVDESTLTVPLRANGTAHVPALGDERLAPPPG